MTDQAPIMVRCEGSESTSPHHLCPMCGESWPVQWPTGYVHLHDRVDILAMVERGDFG